MVPDAQGSRKRNRQEKTKVIRMKYNAIHEEINKLEISEPVRLDLIAQIESCESEDHAQSVYADFLGVLVRSGIDELVNEHELRVTETEAQLNQKLNDLQNWLSNALDEIEQGNMKERYRVYTEYYNRHADLISSFVRECEEYSDTVQGVETILME